MAEQSDLIDFGFEPSVQNTEENQDQFQQQTQEPPIIQTEQNQQEQEVSQQQQNNSGEFDIKELYSYLKDNNIAPELENLDNIKDINDLADVLYNYRDNQIKEGVQQYIENTTQSYRDLFNYLQNGGNIEEFVNVYRNTYDNIDFSSIKGNKDMIDRVILDYYRNTTQWDDSTIKTHLGKFNDDEKSTFAKSALNQLKTMEIQQKQQLMRQQQEEKVKQEMYIKERVEGYKKHLSELKAIGDIELTASDKQEMSNLLFNDITYNKLASDFEKYRINLVKLDKLGLLDNPDKITDYRNKTNKTYNFKKKVEEEQNADIDLQLVNSKQKTPFWGF